LTEITVKCSGPVFDGRAEKDLDAGAVAVRRRVAAEGEKLVRAAFLGSIREERAGRFLRSIMTIENSRVFVTHSRGKTYAMPIIESVVHEDIVTSDLATYGPWLEGTGSRNETTRFHGYHGFRKACAELNMAATGIGEEAIRPYVEEMDGR
jgi:hypothetical protein